MENSLEKIFESEILDENTKKEIKEYIENKLKENELKVREEYSKRFELDKAQLIEALDKFVNDHITKEIEEFQNDKKNLAEERVKLSREIIETKKEYNRKLKENAARLEKFILEQLANEIKEFRNDRRRFEKEKNKLKNFAIKEKQKIKQQVKEHLNKLNYFVLKELSKEISEFAEDKKLLAKQRAEFLQESRKKLIEAKRNFIRKASNLIESKVSGLLKSEIARFRDDIERVRNNNFGRKIFEAFSQEFMNSYLAEGTKIKAALKKIQILERKLEEAETNSAHFKKLYEGEKAKVSVIAEKAKRAETLNVLLRPLSSEKRKLMEQMLSNVKTEHLENAFSRYLPIIMENTSPSTRKTTLNENKNVHQKIVVTGDKVTQLDVNSDKTSSQGEIIQFRKLAGIE
ncbi:MAG: hypothetical protein NZZ41_00555 [Candidatus Dojkabacteria bacterium]|nr:hypothetical protein [Candidatus Dojkabacteria bacterium]